MNFENTTMKKNSIFMEDWWLDCVTEGKVEFINYNNGNKLNINLPIYKSLTENELSDFSGL